MRPKKIIITIDGFSSCGKSTLAKDVANKLKYRYIDTGAMYRVVTYYIQEQNIDIEDNNQIVDALKHIHIDFDYDKVTGKQIIFLNHVNVEKEIRTPKVSDFVSEVAAIKEVRVQLVNLQQKLGKRKGIVMDGRDIGTVVFPHAELKIFLTADSDIRVKRRFDELNLSGTPLTLQEVKENLKKRDHIDSTREESPLRKAEDAIILDNSHISQEEQADWVIQKYISLITKKVEV